MQVGMEDLLNGLRNWLLPEISLYTFGSPRIGNAALSQMVTKWVSTAYRVVVNGDLVSMIPKILGFYTHCGTKVILDEEEAGNIIVNPSFLEHSMFSRSTGGIANHSLDKYRACLEAGFSSAHLYEYLRKERDHSSFAAALGRSNESRKKGSHVAATIRNKRLSAVDEKTSTPNNRSSLPTTLKTRGAAFTVDAEARIAVKHRDDPSQLVRPIITASGGVNVGRNNERADYGSRGDSSGRSSSSSSISQGHSSPWFVTPARYRVGASTAGGGAREASAEQRPADRISGTRVRAPAAVLPKASAVSRGGGNEGVGTSTSNIPDWLLLPEESV
jgi:hypothetical protein